MKMPSSLRSMLLGFQDVIENRAVAKRAADMAEKAAVASLIYAVFKNQIGLGLFLASCFSLMSFIITYKEAKND